MKQTLAQFFDEFVQFITKNSALLIALSIGMVGKIVIDIRIKGLTWWERVIKAILSVIFGYLVAQYLLTHDMENKISWLVPAATLIGDSFISWVMLNANRLYRYAAKRVLGMKDEDLKDN